MSMELTGNDVIGLPGQNLNSAELRVLVGLADGETPTAIGQAVNADSTQMRHIESAIRAKLGAKTKTHMIARAFVLGVLAPRALCFMLAVLAGMGSADHMMRTRSHSRTRTNPQTVRVVRASQGGGNGRGNA